MKQEVLEFKRKVGRRKLSKRAFTKKSMKSTTKMFIRYYCTVFFLLFVRSYLNNVRTRRHNNDDEYPFG